MDLNDWVVPDEADDWVVPPETMGDTRSRLSSEAGQFLGLPSRAAAAPAAAPDYPADPRIPLPPPDAPPDIGSLIEQSALPAPAPIDTAFGRHSQAVEQIVDLGRVPDRGDQLRESITPLQMDSPESYGGQRLTYDEASIGQRAGDQWASGMEGLSQLPNGIAIGHLFGELQDLGAVETGVGPGRLTQRQRRLAADIERPEDRAAYRAELLERLGRLWQPVIESRIRQGELLRNPRAQAIVEAGNAGRWGDVGRILAEDPFGLIQQFTVESLPTSMAMMAPGIGLGLAGASRVAQGVATFMSSYGTEFGSNVLEAITEALSQQGVDVRNARAVAEAMQQHPEALRAAIDGAARGANGPAIFDAVTLGFARGIRPGSSVRANAGRVATNLGIEIGGEPAGAALGQVLDEGAVTKPGELLGELLGAVGQVAPTTAAGTINEWRDARQAAPAPPPVNTGRASLEAALGGAPPGGPPAAPPPSPSPPAATVPPVAAGTPPPSPVAAPPPSPTEGAGAPAGAAVEPPPSTAPAGVPAAEGLDPAAGPAGGAAAPTATGVSPGPTAATPPSPAAAALPIPPAPPPAPVSTARPSLEDALAGNSPAEVAARRAETQQRWQAALPQGFTVEDEGDFFAVYAPDGEYLATSDNPSDETIAESVAEIQSRLRQGMYPEVTASQQPFGQAEQVAAAQQLAQQERERLAAERAAAEEAERQRQEQERQAAEAEKAQREERASLARRLRAIATRAAAIGDSKFAQMARQGAQAAARGEVTATTVDTVESQLVALERRHAAASQPPAPDVTTPAPTPSGNNAVAGPNVTTPPADVTQQPSELIQAMNLLAELEAELEAQGMVKDARLADRVRNLRERVRTLKKPPSSDPKIAEIERVLFGEVGKSISQSIKDLHRKGVTADDLGKRLGNYWTPEKARIAFDLLGLTPPKPKEPAPSAAPPAPPTGEGAQDQAPAAPSETTGESDQPSAADGDAGPLIVLARRIAAMLAKGLPLSIGQLMAMGREAYGASAAEGGFDRKDLYDAIELAVNMHVLARGELRVPLNGDPEAARRVLTRLEQLKNRLPTQTVRTQEQVDFQQFSTPPDYAALTAYAAGIRLGDVVLEPSAGTGSLLAAAGPAVDLVGNELAPRRAEALRALLGEEGQVFTEDAEQIHRILPGKGVEPTVVVMNPPFSRAGNRAAGKKILDTGARHINAALALLPEGGRLVAIVGRGMAMDAPAFREWWATVLRANLVRANIPITGATYAKYGTNFATRLLVIDKGRPGGAISQPVAPADDLSLADALNLLKDVRDARPTPERGAPGSAPDTAEQPSGEPGGAGGPAGDEGPAGPVPPASGDAAGGGAGTGRPGPRNPGPRVARPEAGPSPAPGGAAAAGDAVVDQQPEPDAGGAGSRPDGDAAPVGEPGASDAGPTGTDARPAEGAADARPGDRADVAPAPAETPVAEEQQQEEAGDVYEVYKPARLSIEGAKPHPGALVQSAAMASVMPPPATYRPNIGQKVVTDGLLSAAQLEAITYAGQAHAKMLPAPEGETARRRGFFIGDGTGVGKGREVAGIILDNWNQGRTKAVWISEKAPLLKAAQRDWGGVGQDPNVVFDLKKSPPAQAVGASRGILFTTYDTLRSGLKNAQAAAVGKISKGTRVKHKQDGRVGVAIGAPSGRGNSESVKVRWDGDPKSESVFVQTLDVTEKASAQKTRVDQIVEWVGADFDGVIAFDEAHNMANAVATRGKRGLKDVAEKALAGVELQARLPNARIVYVSATGATEVSNLAYADRLGLWGYGTAFADRNKFLSEIEGGGVAAMELVARDMKSLGLYLARSLSFNGVEYGRLEHELTEDQREIYDTIARMWQTILKNIDAALEITDGKKNKNAVSAARSAFWGTQQRFFLQIISAMKMPSVIRAIREDVQAGRQVVIQLTQTNEADTERAAAKLTEDMSLEDLDITPREQVAQMLMRSFPVQAYEVKVDPETGREYSEPVVDSEGNPVLDPEAVAIRDGMIRDLAQIRIPDGPLDQILNTFGVDDVAEVTGRGRRFVYKDDPTTGERKRVEDKRPASANIAEADAFNGGEKRILVFSEAGGTGRDYHAGNQFKSKDRRRVHYMLQPGWRADKAVQGLGRTHRTDQASAPIVRLTATNLGGEKRFISTIARRLAQLGALTKGQRQAGEAGIFSAADNLEGEVARDALRNFWYEVMAGRVQGLSVEAAKEKLGLDLMSEGGGFRASLPEITTFLNRIMVLPVSEQNGVFDAFMRLVDAQARARADLGTLDSGMETVSAEKIRKDSERVIHTDPESGAETRYVKLTLSNKPKPRTFASVKERNWYGNLIGFVRSPAGKVYALHPGPDRTLSDGKVERTYGLTGPVNSRYVETNRIQFGYRQGRQGWERIEEDEAKRAWKKEIDALPEFLETPEHMMTGALLPVWDRLGKGSIRVVRAETDAGERLLGRTVAPKSIGAVLQNFGINDDKTDAAALPATPAEMIAALRRGAELRLANDWTLRRGAVGGEMRFELIGPSSPSEARAVQAEGVFSEIMGWKSRYFIPTGDRAEAVLANVTARRPVVAVAEGRGQAAQGADTEADDDASAGATLSANPLFDPASWDRFVWRPLKDMLGGTTALTRIAATVREHNVKALRILWKGVPPSDGITVKERAENKDLGLVKRWLATPRWAYKRFPQIARLVEAGIRAEENQSVWANRLTEQYERIRKALSKAAGRWESVQVALWEADAAEVDIENPEQAKAWFDSFGLSAAEAIAASALNRLLVKLARLVDQHRRDMLPKVRAQKALIWKRMAEVLRSKSVPTEEYKKAYARRNYLNGEIRDGKGDIGKHALEVERINAKLLEMRVGDEGVQALMAKLQAKYDELEARLAATSIRRRAGYVPHKFYGSWRLFVEEEGKDEEGNPKRRELTSDHGFFDSKGQAIAAAERYLKENPEAKLTVEPRVVVFPDDPGGATLTDAAYSRLKRDLEKAAAEEGITLDGVAALQGVAKRRSRRRTFTPGLFRKGAEGFSTDLDKVMRTNINQTVRYVTMDKLKFDYVETTERIGLSPYRLTSLKMEGKENLQKALDAWWGDVNGAKQSHEAQIDGMLQSMGVPGSTLAAMVPGLLVAVSGAPVTGGALAGYLGFRAYRAMTKGGEFPMRAMVQGITSDMAHLKLGMVVNVGSALVNLSQTLLNTMPVFGPKWTAIGAQRAAAALFSQALNADTPGRMSEDAHLLTRADIRTRFRYAEDAGFAQRAESKMRKVSMWAFEGAERLNRATAFLAAYHKAEAEGASPAAAMEAGKEAIRRTQFHGGQANRPELIRVRAAQVPLQFKNFLLQQVAFFFGLKPGQMLAFMGIMVLLGGMLAFPGFQILDWLWDLVTDFKMSDAVAEWIAEAQMMGDLHGTAAHVLARGLPALLGADITQRIGMGAGFLPDQGSDFYGPGPSTAVQLAQAERQRAQLVDTLLAISPGAMPLKVLEAIANGASITAPRFWSGGVFGDGRAVWTNPRKRGNEEIEPTTGELATRAAGLQPARWTNRGALERRQLDRQQDRRKDENAYLAEIIQARRNGQPERIPAIRAEAARNGVRIAQDRLVQALRTSEMDRAERAARSMPRQDRGEFRQRLRAIDELGGAR